MKAINVICVTAIISGLATCIPALALLAKPAAGTPAESVAASRLNLGVRTVPASLRPALYGALARAASPAYSIGKDGCALLPKQKLKACFDTQGVHFTSAGASLGLHLRAYGRGTSLLPTQSLRPTIAGNRVSYAHGNLIEWWRVLPVGFEQGFTIAKRPAGYGELILALAASRHDTGAPHTGALAWGKLRYGKLVVTDANGKVVPATLKSEGNRILIAVNDIHAVYPLTVDPLVWLEQKVTEPSGAANDAFGYAVAVSGSTAVIGASGVNNSQGVAYVFSKSDGVWNYVQTLDASDAAAGDEFGFSVSVSGDSILVGAPYATGSEGTAYVFTDSGGSWTQTAELAASDGSSNYNFGWSVALDGNTALISAPVEPVDGNALAGAAYIFSQSQGSWTQVQKLTANDVTAFADFGISVALDGTTALIGASGLNSYFGAAYVFGESDGTWTQAAKLVPSDGATLEFFGISVALDDSTALVGAYYQNVGANDHQGAAYVFTQSNGTWSQAQKLTASDGASGDRFGISVALDDSEALVGAYNAGVNGNAYQGAAYVFTQSNGNWSQEQKLAASDGAANDWFGSAVALSGSTALVAALNATVGGNGAEGAAYFYGESNLGLTVSAPQTVGQGQQYTSQTIATNSSSAASPAVSATIAVPAAASFVSATASQGSCNEASGVVTCNFGQIAGNAGMATANVTLKATGSAGTTIENTASIAKATPALTASAPTGITSPAACQAGYTEFSGHLDAGESFTSDPITVSEAGQKYVDLMSPASFAFFTITDTRYGQHTYVYPHVKHGHRWGAAGTYQVGVQAGPDAGGDYTLCVNLNPSQ